MRILISHYQFDLGEWFAEGHRLTAAEAEAVNEWRSRCIIWNFQRAVSTAARHLPTGEFLSDETLAELQRQISELDKRYIYRRQADRRQGAIEAAAEEIARRETHASLQRRGEFLNDADFQKAVDEMAALPSTRSLAREVLKAKRGVVRQTLRVEEIEF